MKIDIDYHVGKEVILICKDDTERFVGTLFKDYDGTYCVGDSHYFSPTSISGIMGNVIALK